MLKVKVLKYSRGTCIIHVFLLITPEVLIQNYCIKLRKITYLNLCNLPFKSFQISSILFEIFKKNCNINSKFHAFLLITPQVLVHNYCIWYQKMANLNNSRFL